MPTLSAPHQMAAPSDLAHYGEKGGRWEDLFSGSYGYMTVSAVGFNLDQTQALLHVDHFCGLCGHGGYVLLRKVKGRWEVRAEADSWIS